MTAVNFVVQPDCITIFTDAVFVDPEGMIGGLMSKVVLLPHLSAAFVVRGAVEHHQKISFALGQLASDFDTLVQRGPNAAVAEAQIIRSPHGQNFDLSLVGWSTARSAFEAYRLEWRGEALPVGWTYVRAPSAVSPYNEAIGAAMAAGGIVPGQRPPPVREFGRIVLAAQRENAVEAPDGRMVRAVGGHCEMTTIRRAGITSEILQSRPEDRIGGPVGG